MKKTLAKILCGAVLVPTAFFGCNDLNEEKPGPRPRPNLEITEIDRHFNALEGVLNTSDEELTKLKFGSDAYNRKKDTIFREMDRFELYLFDKDSKRRFYNMKRVFLEDLTKLEAKLADCDEERLGNNPDTETQKIFYMDKEQVRVDTFRYTFEDGMVTYVKFDNSGFEAGLSMDDPIYQYEQHKNGLSTATVFSKISHAPTAFRFFDGTLRLIKEYQNVQIIDARNDGTIDAIIYYGNEERGYINLDYDKEEYSELYEEGTKLLEQMKETLRISEIEKEAANFEFPQSGTDLDRAYFQFDGKYLKAAEEKVKEMIEAEEEKE